MRPARARALLAWTAHASSIQLVLYFGAQYPSGHKGNAFVTWHGSWNRDLPSSYKIVHVYCEIGEPKSVTSFSTGFLNSRCPSGW